jgi:hypothetical protein
VGCRLSGKGEFVAESAILEALSRTSRGEAAALARAGRLYRDDGRDVPVQAVAFDATVCWRIGEREAARSTSGSRDRSRRPARCSVRQGERGHATCRCRRSPPALGKGDARKSRSPSATRTRGVGA